MIVGRQTTGLRRTNWTALVGAPNLGGVAVIEGGTQRGVAVVVVGVGVPDASCRTKFRGTSAVTRHCDCNLGIYLQCKHRFGRYQPFRSYLCEFVPKTNTFSIRERVDEAILCCHSL